MAYVSPFIPSTKFGALRQHDCLAYPAQLLRPEKNKNITKPMISRKLAMHARVATGTQRPLIGEETRPIRKDPNWNRVWTWRDHKIRYSVLGEQNTGPAILFVHGFGASCEHWRYNMPHFAALGHRAYAIDLLGFGFSDKPTTPNGFSTYSAFVWSQQIADFMKDIVQTDAYLVGNSLGGYSVMNTTAFFPQLVRGLVLVNSAGPLLPNHEVNWDVSWDITTADPFRRDPFEAKDVAELFLDLCKRMLSLMGFLAFRRVDRIRSVLNQVYTNDRRSANLDELTEFIYEAAMTENAFEVFYRTAIGGKAMRTGYSVNNLCARIAQQDIPVALLWGINDPWITNERAEQILECLGPDNQNTSFLPINAGHCPMDERYVEFNAKLEEWVEKLENENRAVRQ